MEKVNGSLQEKLLDTEKRLRQAIVESAANKTIEINHSPSPSSFIPSHIIQGNQFIFY